MGGSALHGLDYLVIVLYLITSISIGTWFCRGQTDLKDFFVAGRSIGWVVVSLTIIASNLSDITYMGVPEIAVRIGLKPAAGSLLLLGPMVCALVVVIVVKLFYRLNIITIYEYLERRYGLPMRVLASALFFCAKFGWLSTVLYVPSLTLQVVTGFPMVWCIVLIGSISTAYSAFGGTRAVIWTDVMQFFVLVGGIIASLAVIFYEYSPATIWKVASDTDLGLPKFILNRDHTTMFDFSLNFFTEFTIWSIISFMLVTTFFDYGLNQIVVQRYLAAKSLKDCVKGVMRQSFAVLPIIWGLYLVGLGLLTYYHHRPEAVQELINLDRPSSEVLARLSPDAATALVNQKQAEGMKKIFAHFIVTAMPSGLAGLVFAAMLATTMSCVSSAVNAIAAVGIMDYYKRFFHAPSKSEEHYLKIARYFSWGAGLLATILALYVGLIGSRIIDILGVIYGYLTGPLVALFVLGVLSKRANLAGVFCGTFLGLLAVASVDHFKTLAGLMGSMGWMTPETVGMLKAHPKVFWQWYPLIGFLTASLSGAILSLFIGKKPTSEQLATNSIKVLAS